MKVSNLLTNLQKHPINTKLLNVWGIRPSDQHNFYFHIVLPFLESIVYDCLQHQSVSNVGGATKVEHVYAPQNWVSITQTARGKSIQSIMHQSTNDFSLIEYNRIS